MNQVVSRLTENIIKYLQYRFYSSQFKRYLKLQGFENKKAQGEDEYIKKWSALCSRVEPYSYRFFSHYCGFNPNIVPEDIGHSYIEEVLDPKKYVSTYSDKNLFPVIIGKEHMPRTVVCRINGGNLLDADYHLADKDLYEYVGKADSLILKPSINSMSGRRILKFNNENGVFLSVGDKTPLTKEFLLSYNSDFCLQEAVTQSPFMSNLCSTSVNTIRLCLYRSVKDENSFVTSSIIRIGKDGSVVDNAHAGGMFIGVDVATGKLGNFVIDQFGNKQTTWNGIDYSKQSFVVPNWDEVIAFAKLIGSKVLHHRLLALDIAVKSDGKPVLIEYNLGNFSYWLFMYTNQEVFGPFTDEIIDYCKTKLSK